MSKLTVVDWVAFVLVIVGALNWGLVGLFEFNLVTEIFGEGSGLSRVIFTLVGITGIYLVFVLSHLGRTATAERE